MPSSARPAPTTGAAPARRRGWRDSAVIVWMLLALGVALTHTWIPESTWLLIHLVGLGIITHSIMVWSAYFTRALLKVRDDGGRRQSRRLAALAAGTAAVLVGVPALQWWLVVVGAVVVSAAVLDHVLWLVRSLRTALPARFAVAVRFYAAAGSLLPVGAGFGAALAFGLSETWHARLLVAHTMTMLLGWVGLTVVGTLVTFWPTVLRARMDSRAAALAGRALPILLTGLVVVVAGSLVGSRIAAVVGLAVYATGLIVWGRTLIAPLTRRRVREFAPASIGAAIVWFCAALLLTGGALVVLDDAELARFYPTLGGVWAVGFLLQLVMGAMAYLLPSVLGGGPRVLRAGSAPFERGASLRLVVINLGLLLWLLPVPPWARITVSTAVLVALAAYLPLALRGIRSGVRAKREVMAERAAARETTDAARPARGGGDAVQETAAGAGPASLRGEEARAVGTSTDAARADAGRDRGLSPVGAVAGLAVLALLLGLGLGVESRLGGTAQGAPQAAADVEPTGETVRAQVAARDMHFFPDSIEAQAGDRVVIEVTNEDPTTVHDLQIGGQSTPRLAEGESAEIDLGVVGESLEGECTVVGHARMGMTFSVDVAGSQAAVGQSGHDGIADGTAAGGAGGGSSGDVQAVPGAALERTVDPVAPAREDQAGEDQTVHRLRLEVSEQPLEVAPGVWQQRWTFDGQQVGPTLRGQVGDRFEITLVNDGSMGHSVDFHAGDVSPDAPMRTIAPGEELVYEFTAERSGAWLYHCSTAPMTAHLAAGMHGAVIIEPEGLPEVDREYVLVHSEIHLASSTGEGPGIAREEAAEVDADSAAGGQPDFLSFNGVAFQYDQQPLEASVGERVRLWAVDAGPNRPLSLHVVGEQFDTVYKEGAYSLREGRDAFGGVDGGAQALDLAPAQGGFVEFEANAAGDYTIVNHALGDAEAGARARLEVR